MGKQILELAPSDFFLAAYAQTIKNNIDAPDIKAFADHLLINKITSKAWLVHELSKVVDSIDKVLILGSWYATYMPYMLRANHYTCVDVDSSVWYLTKKFNATLYGKDTAKDKFKYVTGDAKKLLNKNHTDYDVVINTSCEHMTFDMKDCNLNNRTTYVFTSNNYYEVEQHVNCKSSLLEFVKSTGLTTTLYQGEKKLSKYTRYMVIGRNE